MEITKRYIAFDSEGDAGERGIQGCAFYGENVAEYVIEPAAIIARLEQFHDEGFDFVAHNAEYDIGVVFWQMGIPVTIITYQGRFNHAEWQRSPDGRKAIIWDSLALAGFTGIKRLGDAMGKPKLETPQRLLGIDPDRYHWQCERHSIWECEECYAIRDAEICYDYFMSYQQFMADYDVPPKHTLASAAVALWKSWDRPGKFHIRSKRIADLGRLAYHGGRTEVFVYGYAGTLYAADFDSMYPAVMHDCPMPDPSTLHYMEGRGITARVLAYEGVSEVKITVPNMHIPPLGVVHDDRYFFPVGTLRGAWPHCELRAALARGCHIERIYRTAYSETVVSPFITFIDILHDLKSEYKKKGDPRAIVAKLLMNSLYGRMGLSGSIEKRLFRPATATDTPATINDWDMHIGSGRIMLSRLTSLNRLPTDANIMWAANITGYARVKLLEAMEAQGEALAYCDTDSVYSRAPINGLGEGLGQLTDEGVWDESLFIAPKMYRLISAKHGKKVKAKGVPRDVAEQYIETGEATFSHAVRIAESLISGAPVGSWLPLTRRQQLQPAKRHLRNPDWRAVQTYSDTEPVSLEPVDDEDTETGSDAVLTSLYLL